MQKFCLPFDEKEEIFKGTFKNVPRDFILLLKNKGLLEKVRPEFVELMPENFDTEVNTDPIANTKELWVFFYLKVKATPEMKIATQEYLSRDIDINDEDDTLEFSILVPKNSEFVEKMDDNEIILNF